MGLNLLDRVMRKSRADKARLILDIMLNVLMLVLIYQVSTNCIWFLGPSVGNLTCRLQQLNVSAGHQYKVDSQGNMVDVTGDSNFSAFNVTPKVTFYPDAWGTCVNLTVTYYNCTTWTEVG